jgi:hypothetical protein
VATRAATEGGDSRAALLEQPGGSSAAQAQAPKATKQAHAMDAGDDSGDEVVE